MNYDLIIIGGGPAGAAAGVYAARKKIKTLLITESWGGQSTDSVGIENWIGTVKIPGVEFGQILKNHVAAYASNSVLMKEGEKVENIERWKEENKERFKIKTDRDTYDTKTVLIATGSTRRKLEIPGAKEYEGKGIVYCASCDGPLFSDQDVVVIGGGNAAFESAAQLLAYCKSVTLLNRGDKLKADPVTIDTLSKNVKFKIIKNAIPVEIKGDGFVTGIMYEDSVTREKILVPATGIFVEIGLLPTTWFAEGSGAEMNEIKQIKVDPRNQRTSVHGLWAAGDCTDGLFHQNNIAAGDAVKALEDIYLELQKM
ncbi:MAG TPA: FAD-dependent oxidoreductase [Candidatus Paceibacterota bacterium]